MRPLILASTLILLSSHIYMTDSQITLGGAGLGGLTLTGGSLFGTNTLLTGSSAYIGILGAKAAALAAGVVGAFLGNEYYEDNNYIPHYYDVGHGHYLKRYEPGPNRPLPPPPHGPGIHYNRRRVSKHPSEPLPKFRRRQQRFKRDVVEDTSDYEDIPDYPDFIDEVDTEYIQNLLLKANQNDFSDCSKKFICMVHSKPVNSLNNDEKIFKFGYGRNELDYTSASVEFDLAAKIGTYVGIKQCEKIYARCAVDYSELSKIASSDQSVVNNL